MPGVPPSEVGYASMGQQKTDRQAQEGDGGEISLLVQPGSDGHGLAR